MLGGKVKYFVAESPKGGRKRKEGKGLLRWGREGSEEKGEESPKQLQLGGLRQYSE